MSSPTTPVRGVRRRAPVAPGRRVQPRRASLTVASGLLGLGTVVTRLAILVVMALLTRGAGTAAAGYYALATLSASFAAAALSLGLPTYLNRDVPAGEVAPGEVVRLHWARFAVLAMAAGVSFPLTAVLLPGRIQTAFLLLFAASLLEQWNETAWVLIRGTRIAWVEALTNACASTLLVTACAVDAWLRHGLGIRDAAGIFIVVAVARSAAACAIVGMWRIRRSAGRVGFPTHVRRALPYFASDLLGLMYFRGDVFVLALFVAGAQVGEYVSAAAIVGPAVQVAASMGLGALAYAAGSAVVASGDVDRRTFAFFAVCGQAAAGLLGVGLPVAVTVLFGRNGHAILALALILALFLAMRFANFGLSAILVARGRAMSRMVVLALSIAGNVALNLALDGRWGAHGAAWATVLTELIVAGSLLWFVGDRTLTRPVVFTTAGVAAVAGAVVALLQILPAERVAPAMGVLFLAIAAVSVVRQQRAERRRISTEAEAG